MLLVGVVVAIGCGERPQIAPLTGKVVFDGKPLEFGSVMLQPVAGGEPSRAQIQRDGTFTVTTRGIGDGARVGLNLVRVTCFAGQKPGSGVMATEGEPVLGASLIPTRYNSFGSSGLTVDVQPGQNEPFIIELRSN